MSNLETVKMLLLARLKALIALLGVILGYLQAFQVANPNPKIGALIALLTVLGVHQVRNA